MIYKIIKTKITKVYEYYHEDIAMCKGFTEVGTYRYITYTNHSIQKRYIRDKIENAIRYVECDYNIIQGSVLDGMTIEKVEINNGEVVLYSSYISDEIEIIGKSKEQLEDEMIEEFLKELSTIRSVYIYSDVINNIVSRRNRMKTFGDYDNFIPCYAYDYINNHRDVDNLLLYFYKVRHEYEKYTKTPLERYALQKMEISYWRSILGW